MSVVAAAERPQIRRKSHGLDFLKNVNDSGVRKLAINSNNVSSAGKRPGRLCKTLGLCRAAGSHFRVFSKYPQDIINRFLFVRVYNCQEHVEWAVEIRGACTCDTDIYDCGCIVCVWACEASPQCWINRRKFHSPQTQLTRRWILPFRLELGNLSLNIERRVNKIKGATTLNSTKWLWHTTVVNGVETQAWPLSLRKLTRDKLNAHWKPMGV